MFDVFIIRKSDNEIVEVIGRNMNEAQATRRAIAGQINLNTDEYYVDEYDSSSELKKGETF